jgi:hypothetical protein
MAQEKTLQQKGTKSEENMFRPFMEIATPLVTEFSSIFTVLLE